MDILAIVHARLNFIERFYNQPADAFDQIKEKIEAAEEPYRSKLADPGL